MHGIVDHHDHAPPPLRDAAAETHPAAQAGELLAQAADYLERAAVCVSTARDKAAGLGDLTEGTVISLDSVISQTAQQRGIVLAEQGALVETYAAAPAAAETGS